MNWGGLLRVVAPKLLGVVASGLAGWIFAHTHGAVTLNPDQMVELGVSMLGAYAAGHVSTAAVINPTAAASPIVAQEGAEVKKQLTVEQSENEVKK